MRLFVAIQFPDVVRREIAAWVRSLAQCIPDPEHRLHWVKDDQLHLTLKFLGETRDEQLPRLRQALKAASRNQACFSLGFAKVGHFGGRVIWLGLESGTTEVARLSKLIEAACEPLGFAIEGRKFHPHITLARSKINPGTVRPANLPVQLTQKAFDAFTVKDAALIRSTLKPSGSIYETLERYPLL